ncbi:MAG: helix-turn-helix domain-containing protein [Bryobacterales bacterium]|nr:helix-turn-helix domain-containing protein [Bryobacterales bacterium]
MAAVRNAFSDVAAFRMSRGVSLQQISHSTKIGVFYLDAIENGEIEKLPGGIYTKSYLRQYAQAIGYSEQELLGRYSGMRNDNSPARCGRLD